MYINYGDKNFFECGVLVESIHSDTEFSILYCMPYSDKEDMYQFGDCQVDVTDSWIDKRAIMDYIGMDEKSFNPVEFAIGCIDYYGAANFGACNYAYDWERMSQAEIKDIFTM